MNREGLVSLIITSMVLFDLLLLGFVGCVERKYDEDNYPVVVEKENDVDDSQDVFEEEDTTQDITIPEEETIDDTGDPMDQEDLDQFTDFDESETEGMEPDTADLVEDIQTLLADIDSISVDMGNPKYPPCHGAFAKSCKQRCTYNANCPCQCDKACAKAKDCCKDLTQFCPEGEKPEDKDTSSTVDTPPTPPDTQLGPGECPKNCTSWYNGCNTCQCKDGKIGGCTKMGCPTKKEPYCKKYKT